MEVTHATAIIILLVVLTLFGIGFSFSGNIQF